MKLNDAQLQYLHDWWRIPIDRIRPLDAYRGWVNIGDCARCPDYIESIILCDDDGHVQYSFMTDGQMPGEDILPALSDEYEYGDHLY